MSSSFAKPVAIEYQAAYESVFRRSDKKHMNVRDLKALRKQLDKYVSLYADCIKTAPSREHLCRYVNGQVSDLDRKVVEVPSSQRGWLKRPAVVRPRIRTRLAGGAHRSRRVDEIAKRARRPLQAFHIKDTGKGPPARRAMPRFEPFVALSGCDGASPISKGWPDCAP